MQEHGKRLLSHSELPVCCVFVFESVGCVGPGPMLVRVLTIRQMRFLIIDASLLIQERETS